MVIEREGVDIDTLARRFFYILFTIYAAFLVIFAKQDNDIIANLAGALMLALFILYQIVFTTKTLYLNSMLVIYFLFYLLCILSLTWSIDLSYSSYTVIRMTQIFINLVFLYNILKVFKIHEAIFTGLMIGTLFNALLALNILTVAEPIYWARRFIGTTMISNAIGAYAVFSLFGSILLLQNAKNRAWIVVNLLNVLATYYIIILTASRSSLVIASVILANFFIQLLIYRETRKYLVLFIVLVVFLILYYVNLEALAKHFNYAMYRLSGIFGTIQGQHADSSTLERFSFIKIMVEVFKEHPFIGTGVNTSRVFLHGFYTHNNYIELLGTMGLFGALLYYSNYVYLIIKSFKIKDFWTKYYVLLFISVLLMDDFAAVTFYSKMTLMLLMVLHYMAEEKSKIN